MRLLQILADSVVDGPGLRTVIFFAGCPHHCPGCHNPDSWLVEGGADYSVAEVVEQLRTLGSRRITISGGEPFLQRTALVELIAALAGYEIYLFTGYTMEQLLREEQSKWILSRIDCLIDGRYVQALPDHSLLIRGSTNQRILKADALKTYLS
ncbi:anaerobic ribonucleoside-triphosphate reductase activating protein [Exiguobacterium sp. KRL4]|uniref:anaerobic ribonucleoside-triphosphate reductase activating protein n=1 Tax=Exiguobacterium sp. KRL4 TaxID=1914536 RepID=UPI0008F89B18|nr:anaerobic ribonucleoside-triphosphate reductase activating protein [Exiguobacterium sp. KRL4]OIN68248.1 anaerobic ribonucleoside-triphosphate reductase activating protein [Exiguobacterium sp. KRL4]